jgi:hypothetical protein
MRRLPIPARAGLLLGPVLGLALTLGACSSDDSAQPDSSPAPAASGSSDSGSESSAELASVVDDANRVTPPLEAHFFEAGPAATPEEAVAALAEIRLELSPGNRVGDYVYDRADEDFRLCIEGPSGAFATYDTSPMSLFETGESGGCP